MVEYIARDAARPDAFCIGVSCQDCPFLKSPLYGGCRIDDFIASIPAADVRPVVHGKWTLNKDGSGTCSECGRKQFNCWDVDNRDNFCHFCGADMRWDGE